MAKTNVPRLAILGTGPIGLEAALYAKQLQCAFAVFERGRIGEHMMRWGHVRLFSPFGMNSTPLGRQQIKSAKPSLNLPSDDAILTGREHVSQYLAPVAELLQSHIQAETQVLKISRRDCLKTDLLDDPARAKSPFRLLVRDKQRERIEEADVVLDCTGTYGQHRWAGAGGIPCPGEIQSEPHITFGLDDILGDKKNHYAGKTTLIVGSGYSAATSAVNLAELAKEHSATWGIWVARGPSSTPLRRIAGDPLKERDRLAMKANSVATRSDDNVEFQSGVQIESIEFLGQDKGFKVVGRTPAGSKTWDVERVIANVGYSPDTNLSRELQIHECYATLGPMALADALAANKSLDGLRMAGAGPEVLRNPEPNFFILGAKSFGRNSNFLMRFGFEQVRDVFTILTANPKLDLYKMTA
jgi:thioredoxin reductase